MPTIFEVPITQDDASFKIRTILEGFELVLKIDWNTRIERWHVSIYNAAEEPLVTGLPMHINTELIERFEIVGLPPGRLMLFDTSGRITEAGRDDLGDRCKLLYESSV